MVVVDDEAQRRKRLRNLLRVELVGKKAVLRSVMMACIDGSCTFLICHGLSSLRR
jgi:hypothetical protein